MRERLTKETATMRVTAAGKADSARQLKNAPPYDTSKIEHVKKLVTSLHKALEGLHEAVTEMTVVKSHEISPDGKLGGRGYVMPIKDFKDGLSSALNTASNLMDTLADELTNPNWGLSPEEVKSILQGDAAGLPGESDLAGEAPLDAGMEEPLPEEGAPAPEGDPAVEMPPPADDLGAPAPEEGLGDMATEPAPAPSDDLSAPVEDIEGMAEKLSGEIPEVATEKPGLPYEKLTKVPYMKLAMSVTMPEMDHVANTLRAPILFNMFDTPAGQ